MKIHLKADSADGHTTFTVFINGVNRGQLCMPEDEAIHFHDMIIKSGYKIPEVDEYYASGRWFIEKTKGKVFK